MSKPTEPTWEQPVTRAADALDALTGRRNAENPSVVRPTSRTWTPMASYPTLSGTTTSSGPPTSTSVSAPRGSRWRPLSAAAAPSPASSPRSHNPPRAAPRSAPTWISAPPC